jgi:hypothetical protein
MFGYVRLCSVFGEKCSGMRVYESNDNSTNFTSDFEQSATGKQQSKDMIHTYSQRRDFSAGWKFGDFRCFGRIGPKKATFFSPSGVAKGKKLVSIFRFY